MVGLCNPRPIIILQISFAEEEKSKAAFICLFGIECGTCLLLVSPPFSGLFVDASLKIQTRTYCAWPVVDTTITVKTSTMAPSVFVCPPSP